MVSGEEGHALARLARHQLDVHFGLEPPGGAPVVAWEGPFGGVFVTLELDGALRGCIGYVVPDRDVAELTKRAVIAAATGDPRFERLNADDARRVSISVSVLSPAVAIEDAASIVIGRDGLIVENGGARGLLLPRVAAERDWSPERFLAETCVKAGLPPDRWQRPGTDIWRFEAVEFVNIR